MVVAAEVVGALENSPLAADRDQLFKTTLADLIGA
jgi:hypothetical protein